jgi:DNA-binding beta-propeller fold protein YncE
VATSDGSVLFFDRGLRAAGAAHLPLEPLALESTGDGAAILAGGSTGAQSGMVVWLRRSERRVVVEHSTAGPVSVVSLDREGGEALVLTAGASARLSFLSTGQLAETRSLPVCSEPVALSFTREGDRAYVTCRPGSVVEVDPRLEMVVQTALVGADSGRGCGAGRGALSANGTLLYVPCAASGQILYLDRVTLRPWDSVFVARGVGSLAITPEALAVALLPDSNRLALVDLRRKHRLASVSLARNPVDVALSASGRQAFVLAGAPGGEGALWKLDLHGGAVLARAAIPGGGRVVHVWPGRREPRMRWVGLSPTPKAPQQ